MKEVIKGIADLYKTSNTFRTNLVGGLHYGRAPQGTSYPLATYRVVAGTPIPMLSEDYESVMVQFTLVSEKSEVGEVLGLFGYLKDLFDDCVLTVTDYTHIYMEREIDRGPIPFRDEETGEDFWQHYTDYIVFVKKN